MSARAVTSAGESAAADVRYRPMYARVLGLHHLQPGGVLCFVYFEGSIALGVLLALAELVSWWVVLILPVSVALMVKVNDLVAGAAARSAARSPDRERERLRREVLAFMPKIGRARVPARQREIAAQSARQADPAEARGRRAAPADASSSRHPSLTEATAQHPALSELTVQQPILTGRSAAAARRDHH